MRVPWGSLLVAMLAAANAASGQVVVPRQWMHLTAPPREGSELLSCARQGGGALFRVAFEGARLSATVMGGPDRSHDPVPYELDWLSAIDEQPPLPGQEARFREWAIGYARDHAQRIVVPVEDGYLIGFGAGEYGGSLWWYPRQPGTGRKLSQSVVKAIVPTPTPGVFIVISGLAHMGTNTGSAMWVDRVEDQWRIRSTMPLDGSPSVYVARPEGIYIAGYSSLELLTWAGELRTVHKSSGRTRPASLAFAPTGEIAIGRSVLVSVVVPDGTAYREELYVPRECRKFTYEDGICMCSGAPLNRRP